MSSAYFDIMQSTNTPVTSNNLGSRSGVATPSRSRAASLLARFPTSPENTGDPPVFLLAKQVTSVIRTSFSMADADLMTAALLKLFTEEGIATASSLAKFDETMFPSGPVTVEVGGVDKEFGYYSKSIFRRTFMEVAAACKVLAQEGRHLTM